MGRRKGEARPPGTADKISKSLKKYYEDNPRSEEHNKAIGRGVSKTKQAKKQGG